MRIINSFFIAVLLITTAAAEKNGSIDTKLAKVGSPVVEESFDSPLDNGLVVNGSHANLETDKPNYRFVMRGDSLAIDDLHVWNVK